MANYNGYQGNMNSVSAVITAAAAHSSTITLNGLCLCAIQMPTTFTGTAITFLASVDNVTFQTLNVTTSGTALSYTVAQARFVSLNPQDFQGVNYLQLVSNASEAADRTLVCVVKGL